MGNGEIRIIKTIDKVVIAILHNSLNLAMSYCGHIIKLSIKIIIILILMGCTKSPELRTGTYSFVELSKLELGYLYITQGINNYSVGSKMILSRDSTFQYITCGNIITGTWRSKVDTLYIKIRTNRWRNDSLNKYGWDGVWPSIPDKPLKFVIDGDCLIFIRHASDGHKVFEKLKYVDAGKLKNSK